MFYFLKEIIAASAGFLLSASALFAHHPPTNPGGRVLGDSTPEPRDQLVVSLDYIKGERENRNTATLNVAGELSFFVGRLGLGLQVPYQYYRQKDREDAARWSRPRLGLRAQPFGKKAGGALELWDLGALFVLDADLGFASGADRDRFVDENFYDSNAGVTIGLTVDDWIFTVRGGGIFPVSKLPRAEAVDPGELPPVRLPWEPAEETNTRDTHELKKVTEWQLRAGYRITDELLGFAGFLYRTPYAGVIKERATGGDVPKIYREVQAGFTYQLNFDYSLSFTYRAPLFNKQENSALDEAWYFLQGRTPPDPARNKLFSEAYTVAVTAFF